MQPITINRETCNGCGTCSASCPRYIPEVIEESGEKYAVVCEERAELCMFCGHCAAVCPTESVTVAGLEPDGFLPLPQAEFSPEQMLGLMRRRRAVRRYKNKPVPREVLAQIVEAISTAPTGNASRSVGLIVIDTPETLKKISALSYDLYAALEKNLKNPIARFVIRRKAGERGVKTLLEFVLPGVKWYRRWYDEGRSDEIRRDSPALIIFHTDRMMPVGDENCLIAATFGTLMAETLGVGSFYNGLIGPAINNSPQLRQLLELPAEREVYATLCLGYPKYKYRRTIPRKLAEVKYL